MTVDVAELRFRRGQVGARPLQDEAKAVLAELNDPTSEAAEAARREGLDIDQIRAARITIEEEGQGVEPLTTILVTIGVAVGKSVALKVWEKLIWPRVERKFGVKALGEKKDQ